MNDKTITLNALLAIIFLINHTYTYGMEKHPTLLDLSCDGSSLAEIVKATVVLSATSKCNQKEMPIIFGKFCKDRYDITEKNKVMKKLLRYIDYYIVNYQDRTYQNGRCAALTLVHAGADNIVDRYSFLREAIYKKDKEMIAALFENNVNPNQHPPFYENPDWFAIKDVDILEMFIARGLKLQQIEDKEDVLRHAIVYHHNPQLIKCYLDNNVVDVKKINPVTGDNILHHFVRCKDFWPDIDDYVNACSLLTKAAPGLIDRGNKYGMSPICLMRAELQSIGNKKLNENTYGYQAKKKFEAILIIYGSKRQFWAIDHNYSLSLK